jgi:hypothetical protein
MQFEGRTERHFFAVCRSFFSCSCESGSFSHPVRRMFWRRCSHARTLEWMSCSCSLA